MKMYRTEKLDMPEYFRAELNNFMSGMRIIFSQDIHNRCGQCDMGKEPLSSCIHRQINEIVYYLSKTEHVFPGSSLPWNGT